MNTIPSRHRGGGGAGQAPQTGAAIDTPDLAANKAIATGFLDAIRAGDLQRCTALLHVDAIWWVQGWGAMTAADFLLSLTQTIARSSVREMTIGLVTAEDDRVAVQALGVFHFAEGAYRNSYHYLFTIADDRIAAGYEYLDTKVAAAFFPASPE